MSLGNNIKLLLEKRKMNMSELSRESGIKNTTLFGIINESSKHPSVYFVAKIAHALRSSVDALLGDTISNDANNDAINHINIAVLEDVIKIADEILFEKKATLSSLKREKYIRRLYALATKDPGVALPEEVMRTVAHWALEDEENAK